MLFFSFIYYHKYYCYYSDHPGARKQDESYNISPKIFRKGNCATSQGLLICSCNQCMNFVHFIIQMGLTWRWAKNHNRNEDPDQKYDYAVTTTTQLLQTLN